MSDLRSIYKGFNTGVDFALDGLGLDRDGGLETAVILSLFSDRLADVDDALPDGSDDRRGWWADSVTPLLEGYPLGSRLWLLSREKQLPEVLTRAKLYAEEALAWLLEQGLAERVEVTATNPRMGLLQLAVLIERPGRQAQTYSFAWDWMKTDAL